MGTAAGALMQEGYWFTITTKQKSPKNRGLLFCWLSHFLLWNRSVCFAQAFGETINNNRSPTSSWISDVCSNIFWPRKTTNKSMFSNRSSAQQSLTGFPTYRLLRFSVSTTNCLSPGRSTGIPISSKVRKSRWLTDFESSACWSASRRMAAFNCSAWCAGESGRPTT